MKNKFAIAMSLALIMAMLLTSFALADVVTSDVVLATVGNQTLVDLGNVTPGQVISSATSFQLECNGSNHADLGNTVFVQFFSVNPSGNLSATDTTIGPIPADWADDATGGDNCANASLSVLNDNGNSTVTITAPTISGTYNYSVTYKVCQSNNSAQCGGIDPNDVTGAIPAVTFRLTVASAPSDTTPPDTVIDSGPASLTNSTSATFTFHATEAGSTFACSLDSGLYAACSSPANFSSLGNAPHTFAVKATDAASNTDPTPATYAWTVDTIPPIVTATPDRLADRNDWYNHAVIVSFSASDATCDAAVTYSGPDSATASVTGHCTDAAGNVGSGTFNFKYDGTAPTVTATLDKSPDAVTNWFNGATGAPTVKFVCSDATSGLDGTCPADHSFGEGADQAYSQTIYDVAGNSTTAGVTNVDVDLTAPTIVASINPASPAASGWYNMITGAPTVSYVCADTGSSGVVSGACPDSVTLGEGANQSVAAKTVTDIAGNTSADSASFSGLNVDLTAPTIVASINPASPAASGWYNIATGAPTVSYLCADTNGSGIAAGACPAPVTLGEGANQSVAAQTVIDIAGNTSASSASFSGLNVDLTAPALNIVGAPAGPYGFCSMPSKPTFDPKDSLSGLDGTQGDSWTTPGTPSGVGTYIYIAHAADLAGNTAGETRTYTVTYSGAFSGYLQPINTDGSSRFKLGSTIPVKFQLTCNGVSISNAVAYMYVAKGDTVADPGVDEAVSTSAATTGNLFRYDVTGQQYIFNLSTKLGYTNPGGGTVSFSTGTWTLKILLDDGKWYSVNVQLPK